MKTQGSHYPSVAVGLNGGRRSQTHTVDVTHRWEAGSHILYGPTLTQLCWITSLSSHSDRWLLPSWLLYYRLLLPVIFLQPRLGGWAKRSGLSLKWNFINNTLPRHFKAGSLFEHFLVIKFFIYSLTHRNHIDLLLVSKVCWDVIKGTQSFGLKLQSCKVSNVVFMHSDNLGRLLQSMLFSKICLEDFAECLETTCPWPYFLAKVQVLV